MKILKANRGEGKTTELVKLANKEWKYIVCMNKQRVEVITETARKLGLDIPFPITVKELPIRSPYIKSVLLDDLEDVIQYVVGKNIDIATTSCEGYKSNNTKEYLGIYDIPYVECFYYKILAVDHEEAKNKFLNKLLENENISKLEYKEIMRNGSEFLNIMPLFDIETIE